MDDFEPRRYLTRRKLLNASSAEQKYKKAVLEAGAELAHEFSEHYWKDVLQKGEKGESDVSSDQANVSPTTSESIMKGFLFYLNASGRYLVLREHLRMAISDLVQQKCLNTRPSGFHNHRDLQAYLHDMYVYLVDGMHEILNSSTLQETDRLVSNLDRLLQQTNCDEKDADLTKLSLHQRHITDLAIFAEEAIAQGDFESCHKLHLQRTCKDKESARCWTEFAIMWLSKGNAKMAEVAAREALSKDPLYLNALLISGIISVQQGNESGLDCLNTALRLKQMAPEILVILGVANSMTGNEEAADDFFRKAAHVHRVLTGRSTQGLDKIFTEKNQKRAFSIKEFVSEMETSPHPSRNGSLTVDPSTIPIEEHLSIVPPEESQQVKRRSKKSNASRLSNNDISQIEKNAAENAAVKKKRKTSGRNSTILGGDPPRPESITNIIQDGSNSSLKKKRRSSGRKSNAGGGDEASRPNSSANILQGGSNSSLKKKMSSARNSTASAANLEEPELPTTTSKFNVTLADIHPEDVELSLIPSILSPWDVTEFSQKMERHLQTVDYLESTPAGSRKGSRNSNTVGPFNVIPSDEDIAPDNEIQEEYDKLIENQNGSNTSITSKDEDRKLSGRGTAESYRSKEQDDAGSAGRLSVPSMKEVAAEPTKVSNRLGSELIWAANLLINLRLFEFVDGVLSKHLFFYGSRTLQFIYLRAVSLYLRQREVEALQFIQEAIELDSANGLFWSLEGHCYYNQNNIEEAMNSYEKALKLPHINENRHLLYLRYGSLVLDSGNIKLAKRVFLHGVSKHPTPYMWLALGNVCFQRKEYDQAESAFSEANRLDNMNPISWGHLALCSLLQDKKELAEQSFKWAMRFGLKKGPLLDEIQKVQREKGFGDPSFPRLPNCVPHDYYLRRMGKVKPFNLYKEGLNQSKPRFGTDRYADTEYELLLKTKLDQMAGTKDQSEYLEEEWGGEDAVDFEGGPYTPTRRSELNTPRISQSIGRINVDTPPPDLLTTRDPDDPPPPPPSATSPELTID